MPTPPAGLIALSGAREGDIGRASSTAAKPRRERRSIAGSSCSATGIYSSCSGRAAPERRNASRGSLELASERGVPVVATNDVRFLRREDFEAHEARVCIHEGTLLARSEAPAPLQRAAVPALA